MKCTSQTRPVLAKPGDPSIECQRTDLDSQARHRGDHYALVRMPPIKAGEHGTLIGRPSPDHDIPEWTALYTWDQASGGSARSARGQQEFAVCSECGVLFVPRKDDRDFFKFAGAGDVQLAPPADGVDCFSCRLWKRRAQEYPVAAEMYVRPYDDLGPFSGKPYLYRWSGASGAFGDRHYRVTFDDGRVVGPASRLWGGGDIPWWMDHLFPPNATIEFIDKRK